MARHPGSWQAERCKVCQHQKLGEINFALAKGVSLTAIARQHGLTVNNVFNHNKKHVSETYRKIIGADLYRDIDELLKSCVEGDAESLTVLNAMISAHFHAFSLAAANGAQQQMVSHSSQLRQLVELRSRINRSSPRRSTFTAWSTIRSSWVTSANC